MEKQTSDANYINAVRSIDSVITFKNTFIKLLQQEIALHENEKAIFQQKHNELLKELENADTAESTNLS